MKAIPKLEFMQVDFGSLDSVIDFSEKVAQKFTRIDVLQNNAGSFYFPDEMTQNGHHKCTQINYLSSFIITSKLLTIIAKTHKSRIINVSSGIINAAIVIKSWNPDFDDLSYKKTKYVAHQGYAQTKLYNFMHLNALDLYFKQNFNKSYKGNSSSQNSTENNTKFVAVEPGQTKTGIFDFAQKKYPIAYRLFYPFHAFIAKTPFYGAQSYLYLMFCPWENLINGMLYNNCSVQNMRDSRFTQKDDVAGLWNKTIDLLYSENSIKLPVDKID